MSFVCLINICLSIPLLFMNIEQYFRIKDGSIGIDSYAEARKYLTKNGKWVYQLFIFYSFVRHDDLHYQSKVLSLHSKINLKCCKYATN